MFHKYPSLASVCAGQCVKNLKISNNVVVNHPWRQILIFSETKKECFSKLRRQHCLNFATAVLFSFVMMTFDIGSDITTGFGYLNSGDHGWATFTFAIICAPWLARSSISISNLRLCFKFASPGKRFSYCRYLVWKDEMIESLLEFPLLQPFRQYVLLV